LEPYTFTWSSDFGATLEGSTVTLSPEQSGEWCCTLTDACETTAHVVCINIEVAEEVDATFVSDTLGGCVPASVSFFGNAENPAIISSALWEFGNGNVSTNPQVGVTSYNQQGLYSITYSVTTVDGCFFTHTEEDLITIYNEPVASFGIEPQVIVLPNTSAAFTNYALGSDTFTWVFNQADTLNSIDASYEFPDVAGVYPVTLFASNPWGCADSTTRFVVVVDSFTMYVPNAFTPDQDGINDVWRFTGIDVDEDHFELLIFNRWGEVVHRTNDYRAGWNGNVNNGSHYVPDGVYFYRIETRSKTTQDNKVVSGHITIIR
jgi:gliding motility-associated-like protein